MFRILAMTYSIACYFLGVATLLYLICFVGDLFVPYTINTASPLAPKLATPLALIWNLGLLVLWGSQHTIMASKPFKKWWTRFVPAAVERSTYLVFVAAMTALLVFFWVPVEGAIWTTAGTLLGNILLAAYALGWVMVLFTTFLINHFHLFGLQQAWKNIRTLDNKDATFTTPLLYKLVRHPMMTAVLFAFWSAPDMTVNRLFFNLVMTAYVVIGVHYEEKTLVDDLGDDYRNYRKTTPSLIPGRKAKSS
ncbi:MAG: isoprenylcysteine carboxylmethyltransferase family protein [Alphaproteobacteria bacterium]|nr:MAG: isoprenylcysteine carboxylmethyltransferase family protein [Alphaproteobacteria bacterium]